MSRLFLALSVWMLLGASAFAATNITISVSYTPGAAQYASDHSTTVAAMVNAAIGTATGTGVNRDYADSGIGITLIQTAGAQAAGPTAPKDSATMDAQFYWAQKSPAALQMRTQTESSIHIQISDPGPYGPFTGSMAAGIVTDAKNAVASLPIRGLADGLGQTISKIIGADPVYTTRQNRYGYEHQGPTFCMHTREGGPADPSTPVPALSPLYSVPYSPWSDVNDNGGPTPSISCIAFQQKMSSGLYTGCAGHACDGTPAVGGASPAYSCTLKNSSGGNTLVAAMQEQHPTGSAPITCTEIYENRYSSPGLFNSGKPLGDSAHNSVAKMNARATAVFNWSSGNANLLARTREGLTIAWGNQYK